MQVQVASLLISRFRAAPCHSRRGAAQVPPMLVEALVQVFVVWHPWQGIETLEHCHANSFDLILDRRNRQFSFHREAWRVLAPGTAPRFRSSQQIVNFNQFNHVCNVGFGMVRVNAVSSRCRKQLIWPGGALISLSQPGQAEMKASTRSWLRQVQEALACCSCAYGSRSLHCGFALFRTAILLAVACRRPSNS